MSVIFILAAAAAGLGAGDTAQGQSHDVHQLDKVSFTITGEGRGGPRSARYYKVRSAVDADRDGVEDEAILKLVCNGGEPRHVSLQVLPSSTSKKKAAEPMTVVERWGAPSAALRSASFHYNIKNSEKAALASRVGWTEVKLDAATGLCPR
jgi:hypothetical protein